MQLWVYNHAQKILERTSIPWNSKEKPLQTLIHEQVSLVPAGSLKGPRFLVFSPNEVEKFYQIVEEIIEPAKKDPAKTAAVQDFLSLVVTLRAPHWTRPVIVTRIDENGNPSDAGYICIQCG